MNNCGNIKNLKLNEINKIIPKIPDVCLLIILEYSRYFEGKCIKNFLSDKVILEVKELPNDKILICRKNPRGEFTVSMHSDVQIWDINFKTCILNIKSIYDAENSYLILINDRILISNEGLIVYDTNTGEIITQITHPINGLFVEHCELNDTQIIISTIIGNFPKHVEYQIWNLITNDISKIHSTKKFSIDASGPSVLSNGKFVLIIKSEDLNLDLYLFNPKIGFDIEEKILYWKNDINIVFDDINTLVINNKLILYFPNTNNNNIIIIFDFDTDIIQYFRTHDNFKIDSIRIMNNDILIVQTQFNQYNFTILNPYSLIFKEYTFIESIQNNIDEYEYESYFIGSISDNQLALFYSDSLYGGKILILKLNLDSIDIEYNIPIHPNSKYGTILSNNRLLAGTQNYNELAIYD